MYTSLEENVFYREKKEIHNYAISILEKRNASDLFMEDLQQTIHLVNTLLILGVVSIGIGNLIKCSPEDLHKIPRDQNATVGDVAQFLKNYRLYLYNHSEDIVLSHSNKYKQPYLNTPLRNISFTPLKTQNSCIVFALERSNIICVGDLLEVTDSELLSLKAISKRRLEIITGFCNAVRDKLASGEGNG